MPTPTVRSSARRGSASLGILDGVLLHEPEPGAEPAAEIEPGDPLCTSVSSPKLAAE